MTGRLPALSKAMTTRSNITRTAIRSCPSVWIGDASLLLPKRHEAAGLGCSSSPVPIDGNKNTFAKRVELKRCAGRKNKHHPAKRVVLLGINRCIAIWVPSLDVGAGYRIDPVDQFQCFGVERIA